MKLRKLISAMILICIFGFITNVFAVTLHVNKVSGSFHYFGLQNVNNGKQYHCGSTIHHFTSCNTKVPEAAYLIGIAVNWNGSNRINCFNNQPYTINNDLNIAINYDDHGHCQATISPRRGVIK